MKHRMSNTAPSIGVPPHWTPEQALAVFECLQAMQEAVWSVYGPQAQQAWRDQLVTEHAPPDFDPEMMKLATWIDGRNTRRMSTFEKQ